MTDWWQLGGQALWIVGLAMILATYSYHRFIQQQSPVDQRLGVLRGGAKLWLGLGALLTGTGAAVTSVSPVERWVWCLICCTLLGWLVAAWLGLKSAGKRVQMVPRKGDERDRSELA